MYEERKMFENNYNAILSVKNEVNTCSMKKCIPSCEDKRCYKKWLCRVTPYAE